MLVSNDESGDGIVEQATFCKVGDEKRPARVPALLSADSSAEPQICPEDLSMGATKVEDAVPLGWYVRIQFDELLNPEIEDLIPIPDSELMQGSLAETQPVTLSCGNVTVAYDGYYNVTGNSLTWPLAPSLYIAPNDPAAIPTESECTVTVKDVVVDKDGQEVPADQRGPYAFKIAALKLAGSDPEVPADPARPSTVAPEDPLILAFNAQIDVASLAAEEVSIREVTSCTETGGAVSRTAVIAAVDDDPTAIEVSIVGAPAGAAFNPQKTYLIEFADGADIHQDIATGGTGLLPPPSEVSICFKTDILTP